MMGNSVWHFRDTLAVLAAFGLPVISGMLALSTYDEISFGAVSVIELSWTFWAAVGLVVASYLCWLLLGDQRVVLRRPHSPREALTGLWTLAMAIGIGFVFLSWDVVGVVAMQFPPNPIARIEGIPPQFVTGGSFILGEAFLLGIIVFGLICRQRLAE